MAEKKTNSEHPPSGEPLGNANPNESLPDSPTDSIEQNSHQLPNSVGTIEEPPDDSQELGLFAHTRRTTYCGPLPPPELFEQYRAIDPRINDEIIEAFKEQRKHRHEIERKIVERDSRDSFLGLCFGFVVCLSAFAVAGYIAYLGYPWPSGLLSSVTLTGLVTTFVVGHKAKDSKYRDEEINAEDDE